MKVIFGIGNPGSQYAGTRHNAGLIFIDWLLKSRVKAIATFKSTRYTQFTLPDNKLICISHTYMNESGKAILSFKSKNPTLTVKDFLIVHDDLEHKIGNARVK